MLNGLWASIVTNVFQASAVPVTDEIDLLQLIKHLFARKLLIACAMLAGGLLAGIYAYSLTPIYETSTILRPAALNDLDQLNRTEVYSLPPAEALRRVGAALDSYDTRLSFFMSNPELAKAFTRPGMSFDQAFDQFNTSALSLFQPDDKRRDLLSIYIGLNLRYPKGVDGATLLNNFVQFAIKREKEQVASDLRIIVQNRLTEIDSKLDASREAYKVGKASEVALLLEADSIKRAELQDELVALRAQLKRQRENRIAQLTEAISVAHSLGIVTPSTPSAMAAESTSGQASVMRTEVNNQSIPLYFMGTQALEAEKRVLLQRKNDDFADERVASIYRELKLLENNRRSQFLQQRQNEDIYIKGIKELRSEKTRLLSINTNMNNLGLVSVDRQAFEPAYPVSPRKALFVAIGALLGLLSVTGILVLQFLVGASERRAFVSGEALVARPVGQDAAKNVIAN
ncbi:MAG: hypothetical protein LBE53_06150 [Paucimonas sp.]|jgi:LPS O-antigen subunit length determinant protein (WzzB/FepE family)|nr:hypothetical protein [Paucimonas sp.]